MAAGGARRGRRDNGLDAAEYAVAADVDPRVGEHLLDVLAAGGIAAYLQPASDLNPVTRTTTVPARPTDRLYVDRAHLQTARDYVDRLSADTPPHTAEAPADSAVHPADVASHPSAAARDIEAEWARLVASYDTQVDPAKRPWPAAEHLDFRAGELTGPPADPTRPADLPAPLGRTVRPAGADEPSLLDGLDTFGADLPDDPDAEEGYTPPPPPPLPRISKYAVIAVLAVFTGFVLFVFPTLLPINSETTMLIGFAAILAGFGTLIWRLRPDSDDDTDPDDGAVV